MQKALTGPAASALIELLSPGRKEGLVRLRGPHGGPPHLGDFARPCLQLAGLEV